MPVKGQQFAKFLGVNLRQDRMTLEDTELAKAINADLHTQAGSIVLRLGRKKQFSPNLPDLSIRRLARINGCRYQVAGRTLYRDQINILGGLSTNLITTFVPFRPLLDTTLWAFIADDNFMRKDNCTNLRIWGIVAPCQAATLAAGAAGSLTGTYKVVYTFVRKDGSKIAHESNPSPASNTVSVTAQQINISNLEVSGDPQVTHKRIYRTTNGGIIYLFDQEVTNATTTATSSL